MSSKNASVLPGRNRRLVFHGRRRMPEAFSGAHGPHTKAKGEKPSLSSVKTEWKRNCQDAGEQKSWRWRFQVGTDNNPQCAHNTAADLSTSGSKILRTALNTHRGGYHVQHIKSRKILKEIKNADTRAAWYGIPYWPLFSRPLFRRPLFSTALI